MTTITDELMTSARTSHTAQYSPEAAADGQGAWVVSWLPQRLLTRNQAITAMTIAETATEADGDYVRMWPHIIGWAAELCVDAHEAIRLVGTR